MQLYSDHCVEVIAVRDMANRNALKMDKDSAKTDNPMHLCRLGADQLENSFVENDLRHLVENKLNASQQCVLANIRRP